MPTISFTLTDVALAEFIDAICNEAHYRALLADGSANSETRAQFARRIALEWLKTRIIEYRQRQAIATVEQTTPPDIT